MKKPQFIERAQVLKIIDAEIENCTHKANKNLIGKKKTLETILSLALVIPDGAKFLVLKKIRKEIENL